MPQRRSAVRDRVTASSFRGTVQASTTRDTSFRVVWRGDAFTTPQDAPSTTMLSQGWSSPKGRGGGRRRSHHPGPVLSQDDELAVSREEACALAAWAKREYPSVTSAERRGQQAATAGESDAARPGSLGSVREGVETTVRACVLEASEVERLWLWESAGGTQERWKRCSCCHCGSTCRGVMRSNLAAFWAGAEPVRSACELKPTVRLSSRMDGLVRRWARGSRFFWLSLSARRRRRRHRFDEQESKKAERCTHARTTFVFCGVGGKIKRCCSSVREIPRHYRLYSRVSPLQENRWSSYLTIALRG